MDILQVLEVSDTGAAHPLLRIVVPASLPAAGPPLLPPSPDNPLPSSGDASASLDDPSEEHLVPLVRSIVPRIDPGTRTLHVQPPEGLLDLGRRRALVERIRCVQQMKLQSYVRRCPKTYVEDPQLRPFLLFKKAQTKQKSKLFRPSFHPSYGAGTIAVLKQTLFP